ncbi:hypothetical protein KIN20_030391 [Parelaphostrongylus tenuis]|uniref:Uncharacterized protein n=1 Tax=Parelaphostrongylus tenuis TaxID=148309 RepID=A0AAD5R409_PARTN|nr:hypothetical protein KIN20_030391 [Parelaphostrongylus tenuis]
MAFDSPLLYQNTSSSVSSTTYAVVLVVTVRRSSLLRSSAESAFPSAQTTFAFPVDEAMGSYAGDTPRVRFKCSGKYSTADIITEEGTSVPTKVSGSEKIRGEGDHRAGHNGM